MKAGNTRLSVAPMMDWTDRHCRFFHRLLAPHALLYTEMVTAQAILHGDRPRLLGFAPAEHPVALQLGGSDPADLAEAAAIGEGFGYDEINLNCGCPSERVQKGAFGACLMAEPQLVADCVAAMQKRVRVPVTVKCRIGIDDMDAHDCLWRFIETVRAAGCTHFIVHARKAWLKGLSPRENREIPPLDYELVAALKAAFPDLAIALNGGIATAAQALDLLQRFDSVMLGRAAYHTPEVLAEIEAALYGTTPMPLPALLDVMAGYAEDQKARFGTPLHAITKHMLGMHAGRKGARRWRQVLSVDVHNSDDARKIFAEACAAF